MVTDLQSKNYQCKENNEVVQLSNYTQKQQTGQLQNLQNFRNKRTLVTGLDLSSDHQSYSKVYLRSAFTSGYEGVLYIGPRHIEISKAGCQEILEYCHCMKSVILLFPQKRKEMFLFLICCALVCKKANKGRTKVSWSPQCPACSVEAAST